VQASQALHTESQAAQATSQALRQEAQASGTATQATSAMERVSRQAAEALQKEQREALAAAEALNKTGQAAETASTRMQRLGSAVGGFGQQAGAFAVAQVGVESLQAALRGVADFVTSSVRAAVQTESLAAAFKAIEGSGQAAGRTMQWLKDQANRLGVDVVALSNGFKTVDAASRGTSLQGEQIRKVFVAMAEASRVLGLSGNDLQGVLLAVGQSISKGTVQAEELRGQIGERLPGAFQIAARAMGVTTAELDKMMERGELQATTFWPRFAETIRKEFGGSVEEASKTAGAAFERFHNTMREFQVNVGQLVIPPLQWIIDKMNAVVGGASGGTGGAGSTPADSREFLGGGQSPSGGRAASRNRCHWQAYCPCETTGGGQ
jgi:tape measure domain-containing protein